MAARLLVESFALWARDEEDVWISSPITLTSVAKAVKYLYDEQQATGARPKSYPRAC